MHKRKNGTTLELEAENQRNSFVVDEYVLSHQSSSVTRLGQSIATLVIGQLLLLPPGLLTKNSKYVIEASISVDSRYVIVSSL